MNLLAFTPNDLATNGAAWLAAIVGLFLGILGAATVLLPKIAALKTQIETLFDLHRDNSAAITTLAINTPPPALPAPPSTAALEANTAATEANTAAAALLLPAQRPTVPQPSTGTLV